MKKLILTAITSGLLLFLGSTVAEAGWGYGCRPTCCQQRWLPYWQQCHMPCEIYYSPCQSYVDGQSIFIETDCKCYTQTMAVPTDELDARLHQHGTRIKKLEDIVKPDDTPNELEKLRQQIEALRRKADSLEKKAAISRTH